MSVFGEQLQERLNMLLGKRLSSGLTLTGWRFDLHEEEHLEAGLKNNKIGGPYTAPEFKTGEQRRDLPALGGGEIYHCPD